MKLISWQNRNLLFPMIAIGIAVFFAQLLYVGNLLSERLSHQKNLVYHVLQVTKLGFEQKNNRPSIESTFVEVGLIALGANYVVVCQNKKALLQVPNYLDDTPCFDGNQSGVFRRVYNLEIPNQEETSLMIEVDRISEFTEIAYSLALIPTFFLGFIIVLLRARKNFSIDILTPLTKEINQVFQGNKPEPAKVDEIANLLNQLHANILVAQKREKEAVIGRTISLISHDLKSPLAVFQQVAFGAAGISEDLKTRLQRSLGRITSLIDSIKTADSESIIRTNWGDLDLQDILDDSKEIAAREGIELIVNSPSTVKSVHIDHPKVERAVFNLLVNAIEASLHRVNIYWKIEDSSLILDVSDDGPGVPSGLEESIYHYGETYGKPRGTGLGLSFVKHVAIGHGGSVKYYREGGLTHFRLTFAEATQVLPTILTVGEKSRSAANQTSDKGIWVSFVEESKQEIIVASLQKNLSNFLIHSSSTDFVNAGYIVSDREEVLDLAPSRSIRVIFLSREMNAAKILKKVMTAINSDIRSNENVEKFSK